MHRRPGERVTCARSPGLTTTQARENVMSQSLSKTPATPPPASSSPAPAPVRSAPSFGTRLLARPEIGALIAAVVIYIFFFAVAPAFRSAEAFSTILYASSLIGIVAVGVGLLMIGGEFDLSAGVAVVTYALTAAMLSYQFNLNMWVGGVPGVDPVVVHRVHQRVSGGPNRDPQLPDHVGHVLHPAGREPGHHEAGHRCGVHPECLRHGGFRVREGVLRLDVQHFRGVR